MHLKKFTSMSNNVLKPSCRVQQSFLSLWFPMAYTYPKFGSLEIWMVWRHELLAFEWLSWDPDLDISQNISMSLKVYMFISIELVNSKYFLFCTHLFVRLKWVKPWRLVTSKHVKPSSCGTLISLGGISAYIFHA